MGGTQGSRWDGVGCHAVAWLDDDEVARVVVATAWRSESTSQLAIFPRSTCREWAAILYAGAGE
jgi:hypothetical protein